MNKRNSLFIILITLLFSGLPYIGLCGVSLDLSSGEFYGDVIYQDGKLKIPNVQIVQISSGYYHTLAVDSNGYVWAWGTNSYLGTNEFDGFIGNISAYKVSAKPVRVKGPGGVGYLNNIIAVSVGKDHSLALSSDGTVWAWELKTNIPFSVYI